MNDPRLTGRTALTGKTVYIRHATGWDLDSLRTSMKQGAGALEGLAADQVVVAVEGDRIIGFGIVERTANDGEVCLTVREAQHRRGIGSSIVSHLMEAEPRITRLYVAGGRPRYFTRAGFSRQSYSSRGKRGSAPLCPVFDRSRMGAARYARIPQNVRRNKAAA